MTGKSPVRGRDVYQLLTSAWFLSTREGSGDKNKIRDGNGSGEDCNSRLNMTWKKLTGNTSEKEKKWFQVLETVFMKLGYSYQEGSNEFIYSVQLFNITY
jgi:hypothetical protein